MSAQSTGADNRAAVEFSSRWQEPSVQAWWRAVEAQAAHFGGSSTSLLLAHLISERLTPGPHAGVASSRVLVTMLEVKMGRPANRG